MSLPTGASVQPRMELPRNVLQLGEVANITPDVSFEASQYLDDPTEAVARTPL